MYTRARLRYTLVSCYCVNGGSNYVSLKGLSCGTELSGELRVTRVAVVLRTPSGNYSFTDHAMISTTACLVK